MQIAINPDVYIPAQAFAQQQGLDLTSVIEDFLIRYIRENEQAAEQPVPDVCAKKLCLFQKKNPYFFSTYENYCLPLWLFPK